MADQPQAQDEFGDSLALHQFSRHLRGEFLEGTAWIEVLLTDILAQYFCPNRPRRMFFFSEVANGMPFRAKIDLLGKIIDFEFPELAQKYPNLKNRLDKFRDFRNTLAHSHIDTSAHQLAAKKRDEVTFVKYKLGKLTHVRVTAGDAKHHANQANQIRQELLAIQRRLFVSNAAPDSMNP